MNRRVWTGILAGVLAATVLLGVAGAAYRAGQGHEVVTRTVGNGDVARVIDGYGPGWGHGPGFGFFLFPLLGVVLFLWLARGRRAGWSDGGRGGPGCGPAESFEDRHRRAHDGTPAPRPDPVEG